MRLFNIGESVIIAHWDGVPQYAVQGKATVVGYTRRGNVLVDYFHDGKKPFSVKQSILKLAPESVAKRYPCEHCEGYGQEDLQDDDGEETTRTCTHCGGTGTRIKAVA